MARPRLTSLCCLLLLLTACGIPGSPDSRSPRRTPTPDTTPSTTPAEADTAAEPGRARRDVRRAVLRLVHAGTGRATTVLAFGPQQIRDEVRYDLARGYTVQRDFVEPGEDVVSVEAVVLGEDLWYRVDAQKDPTCYIHTTADRLPGFRTETVALTRPRIYPHAALNIVGTLRGTGVDAHSDTLGTYAGDVRLIAVIELLGPQALDHFDLDRGSRDRVAVAVRLTDGTVTSIRIAGDDLATALLGAGVDEPDLEEGAGVMQFALSFSEPGTGVTLTPPPAREVVELSSGGDFESEMAACVRRHR